MRPRKALVKDKLRIGDALTFEELVNVPRCYMVARGNSCDRQLLSEEIFDNIRLDCSQSRGSHTRLSAKAAASRVAPDANADKVIQEGLTPYGDPGLAWTHKAAAAEEVEVRRGRRPRRSASRKATGRPARHQAAEREEPIWALAPAPFAAIVPPCSRTSVKHVVVAEPVVLLPRVASAERLGENVLKTRDG